MALVSATAPISATAPASATAPVSVMAATVATAGASVGLYSNLRTPKSTIRTTMPINNLTDAACIFLVVFLIIVSAYAQCQKTKCIELSIHRSKSNNLFKMISPKIFKATVKNKKSPKYVAEKKLFGEKFMKKTKKR
jgi:hypothetical protein